MMLVIPLWFILITIVCIYLFFVGISGRFTPLSIVKSQSNCNGRFRFPLAPVVEHNRAGHRFLLCVRSPDLFFNPGFFERNLL